MENKKIYRNVIRSKMLIKNAFLELILKKNINKIKVKDVIELSDISKGTFYAHFNNIYDVLDEIENEYIDMIFKGLEKEKPKEISERMFVLFLSGFTNMEKDREIFKLMFSYNYGNSFIDKIKNEFIKYMISLFDDADLSNNERAIADYFTYAAGGVIALTQKWLTDSCAVPVEEIAGFLSECTSQGVKSINGYINK